MFRRAVLFVRKPKEQPLRAISGVPADMVANVLRQMETPAQREAAMDFLSELGNATPSVDWLQTQGELPTLALQAVRDRFMGVLYTVQVEGGKPRLL